MTQAISHYVDVSVSLEGAGVSPSSFGTPLFVFESAVDSANRLHGPFSTAEAGADVVAFGYASGSPPHLFAQALAAQQPRVKEFYIGRADSGDADLTASLNAIEAVNPAAWYCTLIESRADADIAALAAWTETRKKIAIAQSSAASLLAGTGPTHNATVGGTATDGTYRLTFTGFGLSSPVNVDVVRAAGSPATNDAIATSLATALTTAGGSGGSLEGEIVVASISRTGSVVTFRMADGLAAGTVTTSAPAPGTLTAAVTDADIGSTLFANQYGRTALVYHDTDSQFLDAAWASRCLSFDLDSRKGAWSYKRLSGIAGASLTNAQVNALRAVNCNYFAPAVMSSGVNVTAFTAQGWTSKGAAGAGQRIDVVTSLDWASARLEEALINVMLRETHGIGYNDAGINRFGAAARSVFNTGIAAGHFEPFVVPEGELLEGTATPFIDLPLLRNTTTSTRQLREMSFTALAYLRAGIEKVSFDVEIRQ